MDIQIDKKLIKLGNVYQSVGRSLTDFRDRRRLQGVHLLCDSRMGAE
jgi:hypothetical protein